MIQVKLAKNVYDNVRADLIRPHPFAYERVGFLFARYDSIPECVTLLVTGYISLPDTCYIDDPNVGARIDSLAIRTAMERSYNTKESILHVHLHHNTGSPKYSKTDINGYRKIMPSFHNVPGVNLHGAIIFSRDAASGLLWESKIGIPAQIGKITVVGYPLQFL
jgi:hypothetical protein